MSRAFDEDFAVGRAPGSVDTPMDAAWAARLGVADVNDSIAWSGDWNERNHKAFKWFLRKDQTYYTGYRDPGFVQDVAIWQRDHGLSIDGTIGEVTAPSISTAIKAWQDAGVSSPDDAGIEAAYEALYFPNAGIDYPASAIPADAVDDGGNRGNGVIVPPGPTPPPAPPAPPAGKKSSGLLWAGLAVAAVGAGLAVSQSKRRRR